MKTFIKDFVFLLLTKKIDILFLKRNKKVAVFTFKNEKVVPLCYLMSIVCVFIPVDFLSFCSFFCCV